MQVHKPAKDAGSNTDYSLGYPGSRDQGFSSSRGLNLALEQILKNKWVENCVCQWFQTQKMMESRILQLISGNLTAYCIQDFCHGF